MSIILAWKVRVSSEMKSSTTEWHSIRWCQRGNEYTAVIPQANIYTSDSCRHEKDVRICCFSDVCHVLMWPIPKHSLTGSVSFTLPQRIMAHWSYYCFRGRKNFSDAFYVSVGIFLNLPFFKFPWSSKGKSWSGFSSMLQFLPLEKYCFKIAWSIPIL